MNIFFKLKKRQNKKRERNKSLKNVFYIYGLLCLKVFLYCMKTVLYRLASNLEYPE